MKKIIIAVSIAVLFGGISSLFAQTVNQKEISDRAFVSKIMNQPQLDLTCNLSWQNIYMNTPMSEGMEPRWPRLSTKAYPKTGTFPGHIYKDDTHQANYVLVSEEVWKALNVPTNGVIFDNITVNAKTGNTKQTLSSDQLHVQHYNIDGKRYTVMAFPFKEPKK